MSNIINVRVASFKDLTLEVDNADGRNVVHRHKDSQPITWELVGEAADGEFVELKLPLPGFQWEDPSRATKWFKDANITHQGKTLRVDDRNNSDESEGDFYYTLRVRIGKDVFQTRWIKLAPVMVNDPVIINR